MGKKGYSEKYARGNAHKLVANSCSKEYIEKRMNDKRLGLIATQKSLIKPNISC